MTQRDDGFVLLRGLLSGESLGALVEIGTRVHEVWLAALGDRGRADALVNSTGLTSKRTFGPPFESQRARCSTSSAICTCGCHCAPSALPLGAATGAAQSRLRRAVSAVPISRPVTTV